MKKEKKKTRNEKINSIYILNKQRYSKFSFVYIIAKLACNN